MSTATLKHKNANKRIPKDVIPSACLLASMKMSDAIESGIIQLHLVGGMVVFSLKLVV
ncbi:hypothetical protein HMPREF0294_2350 [Corynebacterium glucuronolyticum ATCC 51867]|nr:hypothetical protein HMPREF0294_2350 [Corynebacterium glucuronolyticum ATCC 51867]